MKDQQTSGMPSTHCSGGMHFTLHICVFALCQLKTMVILEMTVVSRATSALKHKLRSSGIECCSEALLRCTAEYSIARGILALHKAILHLSDVSVAVNDPSSVLRLP